jgi:hypothetical protein
VKNVHAAVVEHVHALAACIVKVNNGLRDKFLQKGVNISDFVAYYKLNECTDGISCDFVVNNG